MATTEAPHRSDSVRQEEIEVDWSRLLADLLQSIAKKLSDIADFINFRTVCKRWRTATSVSDLPPQIPWLLEEGEDETHRNSEYLRFYCLLSGKVRTIKCPQALGKWLQGPSYSYLYTEALSFSQKERSIIKHSLLNPLTKDEVTISFPKYSPRSLPCMGPDPIGNDYMAFFHGKDDDDDDGCSLLGFFQPRSGEWHYVDGSRFTMHIGQACLKGNYFYDTETGDTVVVDIASGSSFLIPPLEGDVVRFYVCFVESAGKILRIAIKNNIVSDASDFFLHIHQLDFVEGENDKFRWVKTSSIGDQMLFLDCGNGISVTATQSSGLMGNCIYFLADQKDFGGWIREVYRYNMDDGKTERIHCPFNKLSTWFVPSVAGFLPGGPY